MKTRQAEAYPQELQISVSTLVLSYMISEIQGILNQRGPSSALNNKARRKGERLR
jgi:hypothetical protein